jgi:hypothetical protein
VCLFRQLHVLHTSLSVATASATATAAEPASGATVTLTVWTHISALLVDVGYELLQRQNAHVCAHRHSSASMSVLTFRDHETSHFSHDTALDITDTSISVAGALLAAVDRLEASSLGLAKGSECRLVQLRPCVRGGCRWKQRSLEPPLPGACPSCACGRELDEVQRRSRRRAGRSHPVVDSSEEGLGAPSSRREEQRRAASASLADLLWFQISVGEGKYIALSSSAAL